MQWSVTVHSTSPPHAFVYTSVSEVFSYYGFSGAFEKIAEGDRQLRRVRLSVVSNARSVRLIRLSVRHVPRRSQIDRFQWNFAPRPFSFLCLPHSSFVKVGRKEEVLCVKTWVYLCYWSLYWRYVMLLMWYEMRPKKQLTKHKKWGSLCVLSGTDWGWRNSCWFNPYPTAFPYGNGMVLHFYQQQESSTTKTVHKVINKRLKTYV